ncbi:polyamine-modulated factor 1-like [Daphnia carinata]|uniref:polyamine-modulated factor 1-like n=1 Tax=Daphnia carinata TaxID=120202 RepID=UPI00257EB2F4|nr:polyamine-modulated factor 1-like [Daphnia carinata]
MADNDRKVDEQMPEDSRFSLLTDALDQATQKVISKILSQKSFADCLPFLKRKTEILAQLHTTFGQKVQFHLKQEFDELFSTYCLKEKLDFLDKLDVEQADLSQGETVWRPTGDPSKDMLAYDIPALQSHKEELLSYLRELREENEGEKKKILKVVEGITETEKLIEELLIQNEETLEVLSSLPSL